MDFPLYDKHTKSCVEMLTLLLWIFLSVLQMTNLFDLLFLSIEEENVLTICEYETHMIVFYCNNKAVFFLVMSILFCKLIFWLIPF